MQLTEVQQSIVAAKEHRIVVSAGAGTGKTRVLTERIAHLIEDEKYSVYDILAVTFTRFAANEMRDRLAKRNPEYGKKIEIRTFHSWALACLKKHGADLGIGGDLDVITEVERDEILREIADDCRIKIGRDFDYRQEIWASATPGTLFGGQSDYQMVIKSLWNIYRQYRIIDYDKIIYDFAQLVKIADVSATLRRQYRHILIDEFQDTNQHIWGIFEQINPEYLFIVGDIDQCLYSFNGSRPEIMVELSAREGFKLYKLERNWRCPVDVVYSADRLIANNRQRIARRMNASKDINGLKIVY